MDIKAYLARIGVCGDCPPTLDTLRRLHSQHLYTVPYENVDIMLRRPFTLIVEDIYEKVIVRGRGGYCFELNGLFAWLLSELGFEVTEYFARFLRGETGVPMRRHRVLRVRLPEGDYIADVGVGSVCPRYPLRFEFGLIQPDLCGEVYRIVKDAQLGCIVQEKKGDAWSPYYSFELAPQSPVDFIAVDAFCQLSPDSVFLKRYMGGLKSPTGGFYLDGIKWSVYDGAAVTKWETPSICELYAALSKYLGVNVEI